MPTLPQRLKPLTLCLSLKTADGIVLAADTRGTFSPPNGNYIVSDLIKTSTLAPGLAVAVAGDVPLINKYLQKAKREMGFSESRSLEAMMDDLKRKLRSYYEEDYPPSDLDPRDHLVTELLVACHGTFGGIPTSVVYTMSVNQSFMYVDRGNIQVIGEALHGGLYYACRFYHKGMSTKEASYLAYFCICEVAALDPAVSPPATIWAIKNNSTVPLEQSEYDEFASEYTKAADTMKSWFRPHTISLTGKH